MQIGGFVAALVLVLPTASLAEPSLESSAEIVECVAGNIPEGDELRAITLITRDRSGYERTTQANVFGRRTAEKGRRTLVRFSKPEELDGSALLVIEDASRTEVWMHTPDLGRQRLGSGGDTQVNLFGTGMTWEDLVHLLGFVRAEAGNQTRLPDAVVKELAVYVLESRPEPGTSSYERIVTSIDQDTCVPLLVRLHERADAPPLKVLTTDPDQIFPVDGVWVAHSVSLHDYRDGKLTTLHLQSVFRELKVPDVIFNPPDLGKYKPRIELEIAVEPIEIEPAEIRLEPLE